MATSDSQPRPVVHVGGKFSDAFRQFEQRVRERAYHLSLKRHPGESDSLADWLDAQAELSTPAHLEVKEHRKNVVVEGKLKGFAPQEIEIEVVGDVLKVFGSHSETTSREKHEGRDTTSKSFSVVQSVHLPTAVDLDDSRAKLFKNGKLKVTLPKKRYEKSK